jgi:hypothetical protein
MQTCQISLNTVLTGIEAGVLPFWVWILFPYKT